MTISLVSNISFVTRCRAIVTLLLLGAFGCLAFAAAPRQVEDLVIAPDGTTFVGKVRITPCSDVNVKTCVADRSFLVPIFTGYLNADLSAEPRFSFFHVQYLFRNQRIQWEEQWALPAKGGSSWQVEELRVNGQPSNSDRVDLRTDRPVSAKYNEDRRYFEPRPTSSGIVARRVILQGEEPHSKPQRIGLDIAAKQSLTPAPIPVTAVGQPSPTGVAGMRALDGVSRSTALTEGDVTGLIADLQVRAVRGPGFANSRTAIINDTGGIEGVVGSAGDCVKVDGTSGPCVSFADAETPAGMLDGTNRVFTLKGIPSPTASLDLYRNGLLQSVGVDYTLNSNAITCLSVPQLGDILVAKYRQ